MTKFPTQYHNSQIYNQLLKLKSNKHTNPSLTTFDQFRRFNQLNYPKSQQNQNIDRNEKPKLYLRIQTRVEREGSAAVKRESSDREPRGTLKEQHANTSSDQESRGTLREQHANTCRRPTQRSAGAWLRRPSESLREREG